MNKISVSKGGVITIEDYDENKHVWASKKVSPLGDKLKLCSTHSKCIEIIIKDAENWDEEPVIEYQPNYKNPSKWSFWSDNNCYDICYLKQELSIPKNWIEVDYPIIIKSISETKEKLIEVSKELHKINSNIKSNVNKTDPNDPYFSTLKEALIEIDKEITKYKDSNDEMDIAKCNKSIKYFNIIKRQFEGYTNSISSNEIMSNLYFHQNQYEKIIENYITSIKMKVQILVENYMIEIENKNMENVELLKLQLNKYTDIISEDDYEMYYKNMCEERRDAKIVEQHKENKTSKYGQVVL